MAIPIDSLQIEIKTSANDAQKGIDSLCASLSKLEKATSRMYGMDTLASQIKKVASVTTAFDKINVSGVERLVTALSNLQSLSKVSIDSSIAKSMSQLGAAANQLDIDSILNLEFFVRALKSLGDVKDVSIPSGLGTNLGKVVSGMKGLNIVEMDSLYRLADALKALAGLKDVKLSASLGNQLPRLAEAAKKLAGVDLSVFGNLAEALHPLAEVGKASNLTSTITQLNKLPTVMKNLDAADLEQFTANVEKLTTALAPLATQLNTISSAFSNLPKALQASTRGTNTAIASNNSITGSYTNLWSALQLAAAGVRATAGTIGNWMTAANSYIEDINLFNASLGQFAAQAQAYAEKVGDAMGIDPSEWMRAQGVFYTLADGFDVAGDRAYIMSQQLTQLSYDLASFFNLRTEDAITKVRGALSGEIEMVRQLGIDLSVAAMQERATAMGIQQKVTAMSQADKAQLRYLIMMERTTTVQGDMARTLSAPANQLRVLSAQATQAARALGSIFIPVLNAVLPIAIAVAKAIRMIATAIASLFGYKLPDVDYGGISDSIGGAASGAEDLGNNLGNAGKEAKKLKSYLMGFDELNVINPPDEDDNKGSGSGGSGGGGGGLDFDLPTYDFLGDMISSKVDEIMQKIQPFIDWAIEHLDEILAVVKAIGVELALWKIAKTLIPSLGTFKADLEKISAIAVSLATLVISVMMIYEFDSNYLESGKFGYLIAEGLTTLFSTAIIGKVMTAKFGATAGRYSAAATLVIETATTVKAIFDHVSKEGFDSNTIVAGIWAVIKGAFAGGALAFAAGSSIVAGAVVGATVTASIGALIVLAGIAMHNDNESRKLDWGDVELSAKEVEEMAKKCFTVDVDATIKLVKTTIEGLDEVQKELDEKMVQFEADIKPLVIGVELNEEERKALENSINGEGGIVEMIQKAADKSKELLQLSVSIVPPKTAEGEDLSAQLLSAVGLANESIKTATEELGKELGELIMNGMGEGFDENTAALAAKYAEGLRNIASAMTKGEIRGEFLGGIDIALSDLTNNSFRDVVKSITESALELRDTYRTFEESAYKDAMSSKAGLEATMEVYRTLGKEVPADMMADFEKINSVLSEWDVSTSWQSAWDANIREARQKLESKIKTQFSPAAAKAGNRMQEFMSEWLSLDQVEIDTNDIDALAHTVQSELTRAFNSTLGGEDKAAWKELKANEVFKFTDWDFLTTDVQAQLYNTIEQSLGAETTSAIFEKLGYDLTGVIAEGIRNGSVEVVSATSDTVTVIGDTIGEKTLEITPELQEIFSSLGIDISQYLADGMLESAEVPQEAATQMTQSVSDAVVNTLTGAQAVINQVAGTSGNEAGQEYVNGVSDKLTEGQSQITSAAEVAVSGVNGELEKVDQTAAEKLDAVKDKGKETSTDLNDTTQAAFDQMTSAGSTAFNDLNTSAQTTFNGLVSYIVTNVTTPVSTEFTTMCEKMSTDMTNVKTTTETEWGAMPGWFTSSVKTPISSTFSLLQTEIETGMTTAKTNVQAAWTQLSTWFAASVVAPIIAQFKAMSADVSSAFTEAKIAAQNAWADMPSYMASLATQMANSLAQGGWQNAGYWAAMDFKSGFESVQIQANVTANGKQVSTYASGGFPSTGQLFIARESGAELVGSIRGRTAVANNEQIVEGVSAGVYDAVIAALSETSGNQSITINLDGKTIYQNQQKVAKTVGYQFSKT